MDKRFDRQSFLGPKSAETFRTSNVAIIGLGGGGSHVAQQLAHIGVENFTVFDPDHVDESNLNRMVGATYQDVVEKKPKAQVISRLIKGINPLAKIHPVEKKWQEEAKLLRACHVIFGCVDTFSERDQIERSARRYLTPYIDIGMDVHKLSDRYAIAGQVILSMPGELCMRCLGFLRDDLLAQEAAQYGAAGGRPQVVWPNGVLASVAGGFSCSSWLPGIRNIETSFTLSTMEMVKQSSPATECSSCEVPPVPTFLATPILVIHFSQIPLAPP